MNNLSRQFLSSISNYTDSNLNEERVIKLNKFCQISNYVTKVEWYPTDKYRNLNLYKQEPVRF